MGFEVDEGVCRCGPRCGRWYAPARHALQLGVPVITRSDLHHEGLYSARLHAIFLRAGLTAIEERCVLAHEIVHAEHRDEGSTRAIEERADRIASERLISLEELWAAQQECTDLAAIAADFDVTEHMMNVFIHRHI